MIYGVVMMKDYRLIFSLILIACMTACSLDGIKRFGYEIGKNYGCHQSSDNHPQQLDKERECLEESTSYDEYKEARSEDL